MEYKPEFPSKAQRIEWMNQGLCKDCGRPVDHPDRFVRCKTCRTQRTQEQRRLYAPPENLGQLMAPRPIEPEAAVSDKPKSSAHSASFKRASKEVDEARKKRREQLARCESCVYATFVGAGVWFCPLPYCQIERRIKRKEEPEDVGSGTAGESTAS